ncbi:hypothetical protein NSS98_25105 [Paenibacillus sp. FSL E2-0274]|uniref:hypothetical protein n=1 Tax=Paenibacillus TaxID=44249 RepID=UPI00096EF1D3|nr:hypothetical protein [Paenibacillus odorifer]OMD76890.1 hypothetical protein BSK50_14155 [Paenibacillus odorifer]OME29364.1 hypothetical protein BSK63_21685 [Paenibacillus odorifer]
MTQTPQHPPMTYEHLKQSHDEWRMLAMHNYGVAKAAEEREQRLKELLSDTMGCLVMNTSKDDEDVARIAADYRTLYPDTPAPKEGES